jgi:hypothetical protein
MSGNATYQALRIYGAPRGTIAKRRMPKRFLP